MENSIKTAEVTFQDEKSINIFWTKQQGAGNLRLTNEGTKCVLEGSLGMDFQDVVEILKKLK